jgi:hypothetical protein
VVLLTKNNALTQLQQAQFYYSALNQLGDTSWAGLKDCSVDIAWFTQRGTLQGKGGALNVGSLKFTH